MSWEPTEDEWPQPAWISSRAAERLLGEVGLVRVQAQKALAAGLAGVPVERAGARMYQRTAVARLAARPVLCTGYLHRFAQTTVGGSILVLRRFIDLSLPAEDQDAQVASAWDLGRWPPLSLDLELWAGRTVAVVVTVAEFVVRGFDLRGLEHDPDAPGCQRLLLAEPGSWYAALRELRLELGRGHPWRLLSR